MFQDPQSPKTLPLTTNHNSDHLCPKSSRYQTCTLSKFHVLKLSSPSLVSEDPPDITCVTPNVDVQSEVLQN